MRVVVVDSADPDFFVAHADVTLLQGLPTEDTALHDELSAFHAMVERWRTMPKATIAIIEGIARGGGSEFALSFDMRFAALGKAVLGEPEVAVGITPGGGATQRLPHLIGRGRALVVPAIARVSPHKWRVRVNRAREVRAGGDVAIVARLLGGSPYALERIAGVRRKRRSPLRGSPRRPTRRLACPLAPRNNNVVLS